MNFWYKFLEYIFFIFGQKCWKYLIFALDFGAGWNYWGDTNKNNLQKKNWLKFFVGIKKNFGILSWNLVVVIFGVDL